MLFPLIKNFTSDNVYNAFYLNALVTAIMMVLVIEFRLRSDFYSEQKTYADAILAFCKTAAVGFLAAYGAYYFMHLMTGYGRGMLV